MKNSLLENRNLSRQFISDGALPVEVFELFRRPTWMRGLVLLTNLAIVAYLVYVRLFSRRELG